MKLALFLPIFLIACGPAYDKSTYAEQLPQLKAHISDQNPELSELEGKALLIELMNISHQTIRNIRTNEALFNADKPLDNFKQAQEIEDYGHYCGGMATTFVDIARAFGFRGAVIQLITESGETHVSSEIFVDGEWQAFDPTFNVTLEVDGQPVTYAELEVESEVVFNENGKSRVRSVEGYYVPYSLFFNQVYDSYRDQ